MILNSMTIYSLEATFCHVMSANY